MAKSMCNCSAYPFPHSGHRRRNPSINLSKALLIGGAAILAVKVLPGLLAPKAPPPAPAPMVRQ